MCILRNETGVTVDEDERKERYSEVVAGIPKEKRSPQALIEAKEQWKQSRTRSRDNGIAHAAEST